MVVRQPPRDMRRRRTHLQFQLTTRGTMLMPELQANLGGAVQVSESSSAVQPFAWLRASAPVDYNEPHGERREVVVHLSVRDLKLLADQCKYLIEHHWREDRSTFTRRPRRRTLGPK